MQDSNSLSIGRLRVLWWEQWRDALGFFGPMNWIDIDLVRITFERAHYKETAELTVFLLGFGICLEWFYGEVA